MTAPTPLRVLLGFHGCLDLRISLFTLIWLNEIVQIFVSFDAFQIFFCPFGSNRAILSNNCLSLQFSSNSSEGESTTKSNNVDTKWYRLIHSTKWCEIQNLVKTGVSFPTLTDFTRSLHTDSSGGCLLTQAKWH